MITCLLSAWAGSSCAGAIALPADPGVNGGADLRCLHKSTKVLIVESRVHFVLETKAHEIHNANLSWPRSWLRADHSITNRAGLLSAAAVAAAVIVRCHQSGSRRRL